MNNPVTSAAPGNLKLQEVKNPSVLKVILKSLWMNESVKFVSTVVGFLSSGLVYPLVHYFLSNDHTDYLTPYILGLVANCFLLMTATVVHNSISKNYRQVFNAEFKKLNPGERCE